MPGAQVRRCTSRYAAAAMLVCPATSKRTKRHVSRGTSRTKSCAAAAFITRTRGGSFDVFRAAPDKPFCRAERSGVRPSILRFFAAEVLATDDSHDTFHSTSYEILVLIETRSHKPDQNFREIKVWTQIGLRVDVVDRVIQ